jgi:hypothetical protein
MSQNEKKWKKLILQLKKRIFFTILFWLVLGLCISKMICTACKGAPITFQITQNGEEFEKDLPKCSVIGRQLMMGQYTLHMIRLTTNSDNSGNAPIFGSTLHKCLKFFKIMWGIFYWPVHPSFKLWRIPLGQPNLKTMRYIEGPMRSFWAFPHSDASYPMEIMV